MRCMKKAIIMMASVAAFASADAQTMYRFTYDAGGNCTARTKLNSNGGGVGPILESSPESREIVKGLVLDGRPVSFSSEESGNKLVVEIAGMQAGDNCVVTLYDMSGRELSSIRTNSVRTTIDLSRLTAGVFLVGIMLNGESTGIKITKE